jgi:hypothetical protein
MTVNSEIFNVLEIKFLPATTCVRCRLAVLLVSEICFFLLVVDLLFKRDGTLARAKRTSVGSLFSSSLSSLMDLEFGARW